MKTRIATALSLGTLAVFLFFIVSGVFATLTSSVQISLTSDFTETLDLSTPRDKLFYTINKSFANGTDSAQCDVIWHDTRTLTSGSSENLDLAGSLTNSFGSTVTFVRVRAMLIENKSASMTLTIGGAASNAWATWAGATTHTVTIATSGVFLLIAPDEGYEVTAGTGDILKVLNSSGSSTDYNVWIAGASS